MRKIYPTLFILLSLCTLLFSCREGTVEPVRLLELYAVDTLGNIIPNVKVELYFSEEGLNTSTNQVMETFYTNEEGLIRMALNDEIFDYYVNVEKEEMNNWYTNTFISLPNLSGKNTVTIVIKDSFESKLTGKYKRRWQQTDNILNGNPSFPNCGNQFYHDFVRRSETEKNERDGKVERYQGFMCPFPGTAEDINQWTYNQSKNQIIFGEGNFTEIYKITEFTENKMSLVYTLPNSNFTIEKRYKLIE